MGALESKETNVAARSSQIPKPLAIAGALAGAVAGSVAGAFAGAVVGGFLAWEMITSAANYNPDGRPRPGGFSSSSSGNASISGLGGGDAVWRLNTDGSHMQHSPRRGGFGGIIVDGAGAPVAAFCGAVPEEDALVHELQAIAEGLRLAERLGIRRIKVATDSSIARHHLEKAEVGKLPKEKLVRLREMVAEIGELRRRFRTCEVGWVPKTMNRVADYFASKESRNLEEGELKVLWPEEFPARVPELLAEGARPAGFL